ncbi:hypothetical protein ACFFTK_28015 [Pseudonocardia petroleophila]|uniref:Uncharacterized protein n=1 Tax=Pseudonocardia petroleophila TaxID=37331 RepID=A0A7G7MMH2_9PSEU|nr:hypothetical protein [Pseudonocardia petroleophila]QNG53983.1 hypothetical protein H6H00_08755 [Pseudonocardia petroleophila]
MRSDRPTGPPGRTRAGAGRTAGGRDGARPGGTGRHGAGCCGTGRHGTGLGGPGRHRTGRDGAGWTGSGRDGPRGVRRHPAAGVRGCGRSVVRVPVLGLPGVGVRVPARAAGH